MSEAQTAILFDPSAPLRRREAPSGNRARCALQRRFADRMVERPDLSRRIVSWQANKMQPGLRWFKYKEGFSADLVLSALRLGNGPVLDPFAGTGTSVLVAGGTGRQAVGIEIMPVGARATRAIACVANGLESGVLEKNGARLLRALDGGSVAPAFRFPHVRITERAFPEETEDAIANVRAFLHGLKDENVRLVLDFACMSVLEEASYTRKDGQYLRWDQRCGRDLRGGMDKGPIPGFADALRKRLSEILQDAPQLAKRYAARPPRIVEGSALRELPRLKTGSVGLTITSPPYANRYDYTRTYALELAWLGYDRAAFGELRQALLSATVENRSKAQQLEREYPRPDVLAQARAAIGSQAALAETLDALRSRKSELSNPHVIRLVENYFQEMALVIAELARVTRPGGSVLMVNDNVQYHGEEVPVDLILSDIAEQCGFVCGEIGVLPRGKGNASQQMGRFGRRNCASASISGGCLNRPPVSDQTAGRTDGAIVRTVTYDNGREFSGNLGFPVSPSVGLHLAGVGRGPQLHPRLRTDRIPGIGLAHYREPLTYRLGVRYHFVGASGPI